MGWLERTSGISGWEVTQCPWQHAEKAETQWPRCFHFDCPFTEMPPRLMESDLRKYWNKFSRCECWTINGRLHKGLLSPLSKINEKYQVLDFEEQRIVSGRRGVRVRSGSVQKIISSLQNVSETPSEVEKGSKVTLANTSTSVPTKTHRNDFNPDWRL